MTMLIKLFKYSLSVIVVWALYVPALYAQINLTSSALPIIKIDTQGQIIRDEPKITARMDVYYNGEGELNSISDSSLHYDGFIGIEIRGSSTQRFPKKSFTVETRDSSGSNRNFPLLGLPDENDWVLYAPYSDKSLLRNFLAYKLYADMGHYAPGTRFCEVIINDVYQGVYVLTEKIKRDDERVNISRLREQDTTDAQLTGGYILQIDRPDGTGWISDIPPFDGADQKIYYQVVYPNQNEIQDVQFNYIKSVISEFETDLKKENYDAAANSFIRRFDINAFVDYVIINELSRNVDAYRLSTFLYKDRDDRDGRIHIGPVWDYNLAFGNADYYRGQATDRWHLNLSHQDDFQPPFWIKKLWNDKLIFNMICARWDELRTDILQSSTLTSFINDNSTEIRPAVDRNFIKWNILGIKVWPNPYIHNSYDNEIKYLVDWIIERCEWIDENIDKNYSSVSWNKETVVYTEEEEFTLPNSYFYTDLTNIERVKFIAVTDQIDVMSQADSVSITLWAKEHQSLVGIGYNLGEVVDVSPLYTVETSVTSDSESLSPPVEFEIKQNYPNPFNPSTTIEYSIPAEHLSSGSIVKLKVYDITGCEVATIVDKEQRPGTYKVEFSAGNIASGVYFYTLSCGEYRATEKMLLIK